MKTSITSIENDNDKNLEALRDEYRQMIDKTDKEAVEVRKNLLLTPFLLSIPVIIILFMLISGSSADFTSTVNDAPMQHELSTIPIKKAPQINTAVINADSVLNKKTVALPSEK
jgi:hypothetical protein